MAQRLPPFKVKAKEALIHPATRQQFGQAVEEVHGDALRAMNAGRGKELASPAARLRQGPPGSLDMHFGDGAGAERAHHELP
ncbi:MAG: hypothetical protein IPK02_06125 [Candidatus Accumulibacter sp.]|uniref:Uncharacterized protein n=1 Tax=Candidatus Accumulibacter affinis TaxID=2954384 RepID=A0A935T8C4_9PROT|nr:hypothetical protein [Candidatus Accumulibacter affinis]